MSKAYSSLKKGFTRTNYSDFSTNYSKAYDWFNSFGLEASATRLGKYKKHIDELSKLYEAGELSTADFQATFSDYIEAISEVSELLRVYSGLSTIQENELWRMGSSLPLTLNNFKQGSTVDLTLFSGEVYLFGKVGK